MDLKDIMLSKKASLRRLPSAWFCLHNDLEMTKLDREQISGCQGGEGRQVDGL